MDSSFSPSFFFSFSSVALSSFKFSFLLFLSSFFPLSEIFLLLFLFLCLYHTSFPLLSEPDEKTVSLKVCGKSDSSRITTPMNYKDTNFLKKQLYQDPNKMSKEDMNWQLINEIIISKTMEKIQSSRTSIQKSMRNSTKEKKPIIL